MPQRADVSGSGNVIVQIVGNGNRVLTPNEPHLELTRYPQRRVVREEDGKPAAADLVSAYTRSVSLVGRQSALDDLWTWLENGASISVRVLVGTTGRGKTRLALELSEEATAKGWGAGFLTSAELTRFRTKQNAASWGWSEAVLVVIDYVSSQASLVHEWLVELADNPALGDKEAGKTRPLRLLLLERRADPQGGWWQVAFGRGGGDARAAQRLLDRPEPITLPPITDPVLRREIIGQTLKQAGSKLKPPAPGHDPAFDKKLGELSWGGEPLFLMMAALTAARAGFAEVLALSRDDLAFEIADKERSRIEKAAKAHRIPRNFADHMAAVVTLCQGLDREQAFAAIEREKATCGYDSAGDRATIHGALLEALSHSSNDLEPILPDMVGEAAMLRAWNEKTGSETALRAVRAGFRSKVVESVIRTCQDYAIHGHATPLAWLDTIGSDAAADLPALLELIDSLPARTVELRERAAALTQTASDALRLRAQKSGNLSDWAKLAITLYRLSARLSDLGHRERAVAAAEDSVAILRDLATAHPEAFRSELAWSLNNSVTHLSDLARYKEALAAGREAVDLYLDLNATNPDAFRADLASSRHNLATCLAKLGRYQEALSEIERAIAAYRQLTADRPDAFRNALAMSLQTLANCLPELNRVQEGLVANEEVVAIYRDLAAALPDAYRPSLALSMHNLANRLFDLGHPEKALPAIKEAITVFRILAAARPDAFRPQLGRSCGVLGRIYRRIGCQLDATKSLGEGLGLIAPYLVQHPRAFASLSAAMLHEYRQCARAAGVELDNELLQPIIDTLRDLGFTE